MDPIVVVVIVTYNPGRLLERCVSALADQTLSEFEVVIWDNASTDGAAALLDVDRRFRLILHDENIGFAAANNRAAKLRNSKYIATLNPDAFPEADWLQRLVDAAEGSGAESVASLQLDFDNPLLLDGAGDCMSIAGIAWRGGYHAPREVAPKMPVEVFAACAAAAIYRRQNFEAVGGFDERFFCYFEDVDLGFRLRLAGGRCLLEPRAVVHHVGSASTGRGSHFSEYHGTRNRLWTFMRNMPTWLLPIAIPAHISVTIYVIMRSPSLFRPRLNGLADAWRGRRPFLADRRRAPISIALLRVFTWSPFALSQRKVKAVVFRS